jgi:predicted DNA-binding transcriptional regulator AlpA
MDKQHNAPAGEDRILDDITAQGQRAIQTANSLSLNVGLINETQLLALVPISRRTAFNWIQSGELPCIKIGRRKLFHWPSVAAALLRRQNGEVLN